MPKFKVTSGEFEVIIEEKTFKKASNMAIQIHNQSNHPSSLGELTLVEKLNRYSRPTGDHVFLSTEILLSENTSGLGFDMGQYSRVKEN
jgi:hypothetical protein